MSFNLKPGTFGFLVGTRAALAFGRGLAIPVRLAVGGRRDGPVRAAIVRRSSEEPPEHPCSRSGSALAGIRAQSQAMSADLLRMFRFGAQSMSTTS